MDFEVIFDKLGRFNYKNRGIVVMGTVAVFLIFSLGMLNVRLESDPQNLWVSHDSPGYQEEQDFNQHFGAFFRTEQIIMAQNEDRQANIFTHQHLYGFYLLLSLVNTKHIDRAGRDVSVESLCFRPVSGKGCYRPSPMDLWKMNMGTLANDTELMYTALCIEVPKSSAYTSRIPCSDENEIPIIKESIFGGISCDAEYDKVSNHTIPCDHCWLQAKALMATYLLNNDPFTLESAQAWEQQVLIDAIHKFNADNGSFIEEYRKHFAVDELGNVLASGGKLLNLNDYSPQTLGVHF